MNHKTASLIAMSCAWSVGTSLVSGPMPAPVAAGTPSGSTPQQPHKSTAKSGWLTSGRLPKRRSLKERQARRAKRAQKAKR